MPESVQVETRNDTRVMNELLSDQFAGKLETLAQAKAEAYKANTPYPHIYFDDFLPVDVAEAALRDFPEPKEADWHAYTDVNQRKKLAFDVVEKLPPSIRDVLYFLNSRPMLKFMETLTGIQACCPIPTTPAEVCIRSGPAACRRCTPTSVTTRGSAWTGASTF